MQHQDPDKAPQGPKTPTAHQPCPDGRHLCCLQPWSGSRRRYQLQLRPCSEEGTWEVALVEAPDQAGVRREEVQEHPPHNPPTHAEQLHSTNVVRIPPWEAQNHQQQPEKRGAVRERQLWCKAQRATKERKREPAAVKLRRWWSGHRVAQEE